MVRRRRQAQVPQPVDLGVSDYPKQSVALADFEVGTFIRFVKGQSLERVKALKQAVDESMSQLGLEVGDAKPVTGMPEGSDQGHDADLLAWPAKIEDWDCAAKAQLVQIVATINRRLE